MSDPYADLFKLQEPQATDVLGGIKAVPDATLRQEERVADETSPDFFTGLKAASRLGSTGIAIYNVADESGYPVNPDYVLPDANSPRFKEASRDLPSELWPDLARAWSDEHLTYLSERMRAELAAATDLAEMGGTGTALQIGRAILDEGAIALTYATGGAAAPFIYGAKVSRLQRFARLGALAAAENTALDALLMRSQSTMDASDLIYSAIGGFAIGGTVGALSRGEQLQLGKVVNRAADAHDLAILNEAGIMSAGRPTMSPLAAGIRREVAERETGGADSLDAETIRAREGPRPAFDETAFTLRQLRETDVAPTGPAVPNETVFNGLTGQKTVSVQGEVVAFVSVRLSVNDSIVISKIETLNSARRKGYATALIDDLFREFPHKKIVTTARTDEGSKFFKTYVQGKNSQILPKKSADQAPARVDRSVGSSEVDPLTEVRPLRTPAEAPEILATPRLGKRELSSRAAEIGETVESAMRIDFAAQFARDENPHVRYLGGGLVADPIGYRGVVNQISAEEYAGWYKRRSQTMFARDGNAALGDWLSENKVPFGERTGRTNQFFEAVTEAVERQDFSDPHVGRAARGFIAARDVVAQPAQQYKVKGFEDLPLRADHVPHIPSHEKISLANRTYGDGGMETLVATAFRNAAGIDIDKASKIAKGYWRRLRNLSAGLETAPQFALRDRDLLRQAMQDVGVPTKQIDDALDSVDFGTDPAKEGKMPRAKHRLALDMDTTVQLRNNVTGAMDEVSIKTIFERDARLLINNYSRQVAGHVAMARRFGIKSKAEWDASVRDAQAFAANGGEEFRVGIKTAEAKINPNYDMDRSLRRLEFAYKHVTGQPVEDFTTLHKASKVIRDITFMSDMGQAGAAQIADLGQLISMAGYRTMAKQMPVLKQLATRMEDGTLSNKAMDELEAMTGLGTDLLRHQVPSRFDLGYTDNVEPSLRGTLGDKAELTLNRGRRFVGIASGLSPLTVIQQRMSVLMMRQHIVNEVFENGGKTLSRSRFESMGIDEPMAQRIFAQIRTYAGDEKSLTTGRTMKSLDMDKWDDYDARDALGLGLYREGRRIILEGDLGSAPAFMAKESGKFLLQFRGFPIHAYSKLLIHGFKIDGFKAFAPWATSMAVASVAYMIRQQANTIGLKDRQKILKERLTTERIALAAFNNAGMSSLLPMGADTVWSTLGQEPIFSQAKTTGIGSSLRNATTVPGLRTLYDAARIPSMLGDGTVTRSEMKSATNWAPMASLWGVKNVLDILAEDFPERAPE